ncbi:MAG: hypothetical protein MJA83_12280 [Gammaproteobacteria bacterium]|nr:hypothetical protein [Gammaproteobacteria bacterium]
MANPTVKYADIKKNIRSGDIFLFAGDSSISRAIEFVTGSKFSHVAMVYRHTDDAKPLIFQAGMNPLLKDPIMHVAHGGAQFAELEQAITLMDSKQYGDQPYWRPLQYERPEDFNQAMLQAMSKVVNRPFPTILGMVEHWAEGQFHHFTGERSFFCAELVAYVFQELKMLPKDPPANWYDPKAFSEAHQRVKFSVAATLGKQVKVDP